VNLVEDPRVLKIQWSTGTETSLIQGAGVGEDARLTRVMMMTTITTGTVGLRMSLIRHFHRQAPFHLIRLVRAP
jgi:hypothetical protein